MGLFNVAFNTGRLKNPLHNNPGRGVIADRFIELGKQLAAGMLDQTTLTFDDTPVAATGTWTTASGSGSQTCTINGVVFTSVWATSDTVAAAAMAALINASVSALVAGLVIATAALGVVTITTARLGVFGNAVTIAASGTGATASGARLTGGSQGTTTAMIF